MITKQSLSQEIALIGAPTDVGASTRGGSMGPEAIRVAGLEQALTELGHTVVDRGNLTGPANPMQLEPIEGYRHLSPVTEWCRLVREAVHHSLSQDELPILLGGDHALSIGSISAVAQHCEATGKRLNVLWLDAHADFNTANTTPSGNIHGMPLAVLFGRGHSDLTGIMNSRPAAQIEHVVQVGIRSVDAIEKLEINKQDITVMDMRMVDEFGMRETMKRALEIVSGPDVHLHVSFDVDFLDPSIAPGVATTVQGGPNYREAQLCMEMIHDSGLVGSVDVVELNPAFDERNKSAELTVELVASLFGKQILARRAVH